MCVFSCVHVCVLMCACVYDTHVHSNEGRAHCLIHVITAGMDFAIFIQ